MERVVAGLWRWYGYIYDGLLSFWPYTNLISLTTDYLDARPGETILELGCGTGNVLNLVLEQAGTTVIGVDRSSTMLGVARRKLAVAEADGRVSLYQADLVEWLQQQPSARYDAIVSVNVIYAVTDQTHFWKEMARVVKPGGRIVATTSVEISGWPIIREQLRHDHWWRLFKPKLASVFITDAVISLLGHNGTFSFPDETKLKASVAAIGGTWESAGRCYGGPEAGVNILFRVTIPL